MTNPYYTLEDAEDRNNLHPHTFVIPSPEERKNVKPTNFVRLMFKLTDDDYERTERLWVKVNHALTDGEYTGTLDSEPMILKATLGETVSFKPKHICSILRSK